MIDARAGAIADWATAEYVTALNDQDPARLKPFFEEGSKRAAETLRANFDMAYGPDARHRIDLFHADNDGPSPLLIFFHGGYWKANSKDSRRFIAETWVERGISVALVNYRLAPNATLPEIVDDARKAVAWLVDYAGQLGLDARRVIVSGNSAGGQLGAMVLAGDWRLDYGIEAWAPRGGVLLSGLYDLRPLLSTPLAQDLRLDMASATAASPLVVGPACAPVTILVGGKESDAFKAQSQAYHWFTRAAGTDSDYAEIGGHDHFSIIAELGDRHSEVGSAVEKHLTS